MAGTSTSPHELQPGRGADPVRLREAVHPGGGSVLIQTPVYSEFYDMTEAWNRKVLENQFVEKDGKWTVDWADFEEKLKQADLFLLCSPHNPLGHVWTEEELRRMMELCLKHHVLVSPTRSTPT